MLSDKWDSDWELINDQTAELWGHNMIIAMDV